MLLTAPPHSTRAPPLLQGLPRPLCLSLLVPARNSRAPAPPSQPALQSAVLFSAPLGPRGDACPVGLWAGDYGHRALSGGHSGPTWVDLLTPCLHLHSAESGFSRPQRPLCCSGFWLPSSPGHLPTQARCEGSHGRTPKSWTQPPVHSSTSWFEHHRQLKQETPRAFMPQELEATRPGWWHPQALFLVQGPFSLTVPSQLILTPRDAPPTSPHLVH